MLYLTHGHATYSDQDHQGVPITTGDIWQRFPNVLHSVTCHEFCRWYFVAVPSPVLDLLKIAGIKTVNQITFYIGKHRHINKRFERVQQQLHTGPHSQRPNCMMAMQQLMINLHQMAQHDSKNPASWLEEAQEQLSQKLDKRLKTQQVAETLNLSYAKFRKAFTQATGISPGQFRIRQRIEKAQEQLAGTSLSISKIADHLGYPDVYSFSAQFTRFSNMPPAQYRKQWQWER